MGTGITNYHFSDKEKYKIVKLREEGLTVNVISKRLNMSVQTVYKYIRKNELLRGSRNG